MRQNRTRDRGFTLIELMIAVAIIGLMASLAIPNYLKFTARTKRAEMLETVSKIKLSFKAGYDNTGSFITQSTPAGFISGVNPSNAVAVGQAAIWNPQAAGWTEFQFPPEGAVRMRYWYTVSSGQDLLITVCGSFPGLGDIAATCPAGMTGTANYSYNEVFHGNGSSEVPAEWPPGLF